MAARPKPWLDAGLSTGCLCNSVCVPSRDRNRRRVKSVLGPNAVTEGVQTKTPAVQPDAAGEWTVLTPETGNFSFAELWRFRELLYFLTWKEVKVRYKQTYLGIAWALLQPFLTMVIFTAIFGKFAQVPSDGVPYPVFAYSGLLIWTFVSNGVSNGGNSLVASSNLLTKVYFPRILIPAAAVAAAVMDVAIAFTLLIGLLVVYGITPGWNALLLLPLFALTGVLVFAFATLFAALTVQYRDVRYALTFLLQFWMFASPIIYPLSIVSGTWRWLLTLNPMTGILENVRAALFGLPFKYDALMVSLVVAGVSLAGAVHVFGRLERRFADVV